MSEYRARCSQDQDHYYADPCMGTPQYPNSDSSNLVYHNHNQNAFSSMSYLNYSTTYPGAYHQQTPYTAPPTQILPQYHMAPEALNRTSSPQHLLAQRHQYTQPWLDSSTSQVTSSHARHGTSREHSHTLEIESQESSNEGTMLSEPINPPLEGFPKVKDFDLLMKR